MASSTITRQDTVGGLRSIYGTYSAAGGTTMTITVPLQSVTQVNIGLATSGVLPVWTATGGSIALSGMTSGQTGTFQAIGQ